LTEGTFMTDLHRDFQNHAGAPDPGAAFRFLDLIDGLPSFLAYRERMREHLALGPGDAVLDVGCGLGHEAQRLAELVGPGGESVGLDKSGEMIAEARLRTEGRHPRATFLVGDAQRHDLEGARFTACRTDRVLMYVEDPGAAVGGMVRALRPGGRLCCFEFDYDAFLFDAPDASSTRRITHALTDALPSGRVGRALPRLFREAGLRDVTTRAHMLAVPHAIFDRIIGGTLRELANRGVLDRIEVEAWLRSFVEVHGAGEIDGTLFGFIVSGRKP
jgi:ubiquinone/menaquinone biosynthesis C-methylase UbiE